MPQTPSSPAQPTKLVGAARVLAILIELASCVEGASLIEIAERMKQPKATVHRGLATLRESGLVEQDMHGHYILGSRFLNLAFNYHENNPGHLRIRPVVVALAEHFAETAHYAVLRGHEIIYREKVDRSTGAMRISSVIGGTQPAHSTGIGKALLAEKLLTLEAVQEWVGDRELIKKGPKTATTALELHVKLEATRAQGFAIDHEENEVGLNCIALPVYLDSSGVPSGAISVSVPAHRMPIEELIANVSRVREIISATSPDWLGSAA